MGDFSHVRECSIADMVMKVEEANMGVSLAHKAFLGIAAVLAVVSLAGGAMYLLGQFGVDVGGTTMRVGVGSALVLAGLMILAGLWAGRHSPQSGGNLIAVGAVPAAICFWWTGVVPAVALPVAAFGILRARRQQRMERMVRQ